MIDQAPPRVPPPMPPVPPAPPGPPLGHRGVRWPTVLLLVLLATATAAYSGYIAGHPSRSTVDTGNSRTLPSSSGATGSSGPSASGSALDANAIALRLDDSIVNITTQLSTGGAAAGTGIVISSDGLVITNNHVIANSLAITTENEATGSQHRATLLGYDVADDVALLRIQGVSGLRAAPIGDASQVSVGDAVVALGNAGGEGGEPAVAEGRVVRLDRSITASDRDGSNRETLRHVIQFDADIQPGDSGGPLADAAGRVIGMNAAAASGNGGFGFQDATANEGYAIPIQSALTIAHRVQAGTGGTNIHIGATRGVLGVAIDANQDTGDGAAVVDVSSGSGAEDAGIAAGDVITSIGSTRITSAADLTDALSTFGPGHSVSVGWTDSSGSTHRATVRLTAGPPA
ncbi:MAG: S1C family serine protease [Acidimicrobiia bacterium]